MDFIALFDFKSRTEHECDLIKYELVNVQYQPSNVPGFYFGTTAAGASGLFPCDYVTHVQTGTTQTMQAGTSRLLAFEANESVTVLKQQVGGDASWWKGMNYRGEVGLLPASAVSVRPQPAPIIPTQSHVPRDFSTMRSTGGGDQEEFLRRDNVAPTVPMTMKPMDMPMTMKPNATLPPPPTDNAAPLQESNYGTANLGDAAEMGGFESFLQRPSNQPQHATASSTFATARPAALPDAPLNVSANKFATSRPAPLQDGTVSRRGRLTNREMGKFATAKPGEFDAADLDFVDDDIESESSEHLRRDIVPQKEPRYDIEEESKPATRSYDDGYDSDDDNACQKCSSGVERACGRCCFELGVCDARWWPCIILLALIVAAACTVGVLNFREETRADKLWVPQDTVALDHLDIITEHFGGGPRISSVILQTPGPIPNADDDDDADSEEVLLQIENADNFLQRKYLLDALTVHQRIVALRVDESAERNAIDSDDGDDGQLHYSTLCLRDGAGQCVTTSMLKAWNYDRTFLANDPDPLATLNAALPDDEIEAMIGGAVYENGTLTYARSVRFMYFLRNRNMLIDGADIDFAADLWEEGVLNFTRSDLGARFQEAEVFPAMGRSLFDEFENAVDDDVTLVTVGMGLIIVYMIIMLGRPRPFVQTRVLLAIGGVISIGLAIGMTFGIASALDIFFGPVQSVLPFLLLGIGVDDMFVITAAFDRTDPEAGYIQRTGEALASAGVSVTVTSLTDAVAFLIGGLTVLPALRAFCWWAVIGVLSIWLLQITLFTSLVALDGMRQRGNRLDCGLCCFTACGEGCSGEAPESLDDLKREGACTPYTLAFYWGRVVTNIGVAVFVVLITIALAAVGVFGFLQLEQEFSLELFIPDDSYVLEHSFADRAYYQNGNDLFLIGGDIDYFENRNVLRDAMTAMDELDFTTTKVSGWLPDYEEALNGGRFGGAGALEDADSWYAGLRDYLATEGAVYRNDVVYGDDGDDDILATRHVGRAEDYANSTVEVEAMEMLREVVAEVADDADIGRLELFPFQFDFIFYEQFAVIFEEGVRNIGLSLVAVFVITLFLLPSFVVALVVFLCVVLTLIDTLGVLWLTDQGVDSIVVVLLVLSIGLAVDYSAHIGHAFIEARGSSRERSREAVQRLAGSVLNGGISTFLAIIVLVTTESYVFQTFFKIMLSVIVFGLFHGLVFLPAVLSLCAPGYHGKRHEFE